MKKSKFNIEKGSVLSFYDGDSIGIITDTKYRKFFEGETMTYDISWNKIGQKIDKILFLQQSTYITDDILEEYFSQGKVKEL